MPDETKTVPIENISVAMIGTGDGNVTSGTVAKTPEGQPDVVVTVIGPIRAIAIRFANAYLAALVGLIAAGMVKPDVIPASDFFDLVYKCSGLALAGPCLSFLKDLITVFGNLERKYPLLTGSI